MAANGGCKNYKDGSCILANRRFDLYGDGMFWDMLFAAKNQYNMRAPWRQLYSFNNMKTELTRNGGTWENALCDSFYDHPDF